MSAVGGQRSSSYGERWIDPIKFVQSQLPVVNDILRCHQKTTLEIDGAYHRILFVYAAYPSLGTEEEIYIPFGDKILVTTDDQKFVDIIRSEVLRIARILHENEFSNIEIREIEDQYFVCIRVVPPEGSRFGFSEEKDSSLKNIQIPRRRK